MFWSFAKIFVSFIVGSAVFALGLGQMLITLGTTYPVTDKLSVLFPRGINAAAIKKRAQLTFFLWAIILAVVIFLVIRFGGTDIYIGAGAGFLFSLFNSFRACGPSEANLSNYASAYRDCMTEDVANFALKLAQNEGPNNGQDA